MGQVLIRNLDDSVIDAYRRAAAANQRSLEAELREALRQAAPDQSASRRAAAQAIRDRLPADMPGPDGTNIIRRYRDTNGGRDLDAF
ncbi:FitA-like ribbon-helix-helix domain-containing protein [Sphingomonas jinjuensis]|nr:hypothetical protein [Sphingomonas jinjuensis]